MESDANSQSLPHTICLQIINNLIHNTSLVCGYINVWETVMGPHQGAVVIPSTDHVASLASFMSFFNGSRKLIKTVLPVFICIAWEICFAGYLLLRDRFPCSRPTKPFIHTYTGTKPQLAMQMRKKPWMKRGKIGWKYSSFLGYKSIVRIAKAYLN